MDYTKDHKRKVNLLLMEKWGYGKKDEAIEEVEELDEMQGHPGKCCDTAHPDEDHEGYMSRVSLRIAEELRTISITEELPAEEEPAADPEEVSDKMSAGDFKTKSMDQAKMGSESGMDPKENAIISQLVDILKVAAKEGNITTGSINTLLNKAAAEAKKIS